MSSDPSIQRSEMRAQAFAAVFDRVVWLDAAAIAAIVAGLQGPDYTFGSECFAYTALALLGISLLITLCVPMWRAMMSAHHDQTGRFRVCWEIYLTQLGAAFLTGIGILLALLALRSSA